jgi:hypothetical protein
MNPWLAAACGAAIWPVLYGAVWIASRTLEHVWRRTDARIDHMTMQALAHDDAIDDELAAITNHHPVRPGVPVCIECGGDWPCVTAHAWSIDR